MRFIFCVEDTIEALCIKRVNCKELEDPLDIVFGPCKLQNIELERLWKTQAKRVIGMTAVETRREVCIAVCALSHFV